MPTHPNGSTVRCSWCLGWHDDKDERLLPQALLLRAQILFVRRHAYLVFRYDDRSRSGLWLILKKFLGFCEIFPSQSFIPQCSNFDRSRRA